MKHLLSIDDLTRTDIFNLFNNAQSFINNNSHKITQLETLKHKTIATLFFEDSTRTRISFQLAAKRLGATEFNMPLTQSSLQKGESIIDSLQTLNSMGCGEFIIRHGDATIIKQCAVNNAPWRVINAGAGMWAHPTQALLDGLTLQQQGIPFEQLSMVIIGDIKHSRVARSLVSLLKKCGVKDIRLSAPKAFLPNADIFNDCFVEPDLNKAIDDVDVVYTLRVQQERMDTLELPDLNSFHQHYGLTEHRLTQAKPHSIVMHPGPINRGIEIASEVADGPQSAILKQVENGVAMRMAILAMNY